MGFMPGLLFKMNKRFILILLVLAAVIVSLVVGASPALAGSPNSARNAAGFTINLLTLLAIVLSVGLVVDDAIVMVENVERHLHQGKQPFRAAIDAARELVGPIIAMTITLAAVYAPIGLQGGLTGALFREFAFTLAGAVAISGIVALTLSPVMSASLLKARAEERGLAGRITRDFERLKQAYGRRLGATQRQSLRSPCPCHSKVPTPSRSPTGTSRPDRRGSPSSR